MTSTATPNQVRFRLKVLAGFHVENDLDGIATIYKKDDVFFSTKPLHRKWPEKFARMDRNVPLSGGETKLLPEGQSIEQEDMTDGEVIEPTSANSIDSEGELIDQPHIVNSSHQDVSQNTSPPIPELDEEALQQMTVNELKAYAEEEEIDLHGASRKDEIIRMIKQARNPA